ncbi:hypothetical protein D3C81_1550680 [compost metagenome]
MFSDTAHGLHRSRHDHSATLRARIRLPGYGVRDTRCILYLLLACDLVRHDTRKLHNFRQLALSVMYRVISGLEPDNTSTAIDAFESVCNVLATVERLPETFILGRCRFFGRAEQTMMFSCNLA